MNISKLFEASSFAGWGMIGAGLHQLAAGIGWQTYVPLIVGGIAAILKGEGTNAS